jgi:hypothetical protein
MHQQAPFAEWEIFSIPDDTIAFKQLHIWRKKSISGDVRS